MQSQLFTLLIICFAKWVCCQEGDSMTYDQHAADATRDLFKTYSHQARPCGEGSDKETCSPTEVRANLKILGINSVDDEKMQFNMRFLFRQEWNDHRLKHAGDKPLALDPNEQSTRVWTPDTFFLQEKDGFKPLSDLPNNQYLIQPDGTVVFSTIVSITLACPMDLRMYPFDRQSCEFQFGSYSQPDDRVRYSWVNTRGVELARNVRATTPFFELGEVVKSRDCTYEWMTGKYSCLKAEVHFKRRVGFGHVMKNFVPSFILVLLSWLAFYLGKDSIGIRALLGASCLQFLLIHWTIISLNLPQVSGYRAIDIWFLSCIFFVGMTLLQLLVIIRSPSTRSTVSDVEMVSFDRTPEDGAPQKTQRSGARVTSESEPGRRLSLVKPIRKYTRLAADSVRGTAPAPTSKDSLMAPTSQYYEEPVGLNERVSAADRFRRQSTREKVDMISRFLFPLLFFFFNIVYWAYYRSY